MEQSRGMADHHDASQRPDGGVAKLWREQGFELPGQLEVVKLPLPPPEVLKRYDEVMPGLAEKFVR